ncbi:IMS domain-containing protein [Microcoleus sp. F6_B4]
MTNSNSHYRYGVQKVESVERFAASGNKATIEVRVTEDATVYRNSKVDSSSFNSWQKYSHLLHMTWEASSPSPFTFTLSGLTRLG